MEQYISKSAVVAEIERRLWLLVPKMTFHQQRVELEKLLSFINTLKVKEVDLKLIVGWFDHIAQIANDRKTLNGKVMEDWAALDEIKCLARNSSEFIKKHYRVQNNKVYEDNN